MLAEHLYDATKKGLDEERRTIERKLGLGHWHSEAAGKEMSGKCQGLETAAQILLRELQKLVKLEEHETDE